uniref:Secreted protein n=1 Tax=Sorangium cellulosum TaxID=56 RepID=A0A3S5GY62_SORCE|nr:hypothetical protein [Sorangium cellulosum]
MKPTSRNQHFVLVATLLTLSACGADDPLGKPGAATCGEAPACGGDPTGSWTIDSFCIDTWGLSDNSDRCDISVSFEDAEFTGHAEFNADHTYAMTYTPRGPMTMVFRLPCLTSDGVPMTCEDLDRDMRDIQLAEESPFQSGECGMIGGDCTCHLFLREDPITETGVWLVSGTTLTTAVDGEEWGNHDVPFCVEGSSFTLGEELSEENEGGPMKSYMRLTRK